MLEKAMDKLTLNIEIVSMRHATRRARVHVINKLVREARKLRTKKGTDEQRKKYQRKADRLTEEVFIIKKLKDDDISKSALKNTQPLEEVIADATVTLETRALARLANHHHLKMRVNELKTKYPTWTETLPQLLPQLGAKRKKKEKQKIKRKGAVVENITMNNDHSDTCNNDKENSTIRVKEKNVEGAECEEVNSEEKQKKQRKVAEGDSMFSQNADKKEHKSQRHSGIGEVKRFTELFKEEISVNDDKEIDNTSESLVVESSKSDPFFLNGDDDDSDDDNNCPDDEGIQDDKEIKVKKTEEDRLGKWKQIGPNRRQRRQQLFDSKPTNVGFKSFQHKPAKRFVSRTTEHTSALWKKEQHDAPQGNDVTVHPSWEAKRKLKEQQQAIFAFQGRKIKFDDE